MQKLAILFALVLPFGAIAGDYATCILKHMPGLQNESAAQAAIKLCRADYPGGFDSVEQGSGRGMLGYDSGAECAMKKAADTRSQLAGRAIFVACNRLYDKPNPFDSWDDLGTPAGRAAKK